MATIKGVWRFIDTPDMTNAVASNVVLFTSDFIQHYGFTYGSWSGGRSLLYFNDSTGNATKTDAYLTAPFGYMKKGWQNEAYKIINFGEVEQTVTDAFYNWFTANATRVTTSDLYALYNGVRLPKIPNYIERPFSMILLGKQSGTYKLEQSTNPWYFYSTSDYPSTVNNDGNNCFYYALTDLGWVLKNSNQNDYLLLADSNTIVWSNHDIPNGSATATEIYFKGTEPVPIEEEPEVPKTTITYNGNEIATLEAGQTATIKTAQSEVEYDIVVKAGSGGGSGGGSAEFNIAYGDTAPSDTSKLWVKANTPEAVTATTNVVKDDEELQAGVGALPTGAKNIAAAAVGTKVYLFGGEYSSSKYLDTINVFDTDSNTVTTLSKKLPTAEGNMVAAAVGTKVYLFGGSNDSVAIKVFDAESSSLTKLSVTLSQGAGGATAAAVGTKVYLFGGSGFGSTYYDTIRVFDTDSNTVTNLSTTLPKAAKGIASAAVGTKVYLFGGYGSGGGLDTINVFDTVSNTIETLSTKLPFTEHNMAVSAVGTKVYLFSGNRKTDTINVFDTVSNTIETLSTKLPTGADNMVAAAVGTKVYLFGGYNSGYLSTINVFIALLALTANNMLIEATAASNLFDLLPNVEIGVKNVYIGNADGYAEKVAAALYVDGAWTEI